MSTAPRHDNPEPSDQPAITCPMECSVCQQDGDCEDCLDCLHWPRSGSEEADAGPTRLCGYSLPTKTADMERARQGLSTSRRVGLLSRRFRRQARLTQRQLAAELGWSRAALGRVECGAEAIAFGKVDALLQHVGYRIALVEDDLPVPGEAPDRLWGADDLLARDRQQRRPPPSSEVTWNPEDELRNNTSLRDREWTWRRQGDTGGATPRWAASDR